MRLVILVPLVTLLDAVEEAWLPHDEELLLRLEHHSRVGFACILSRYQVCELLLISVHSLLLGLLKHLHGGVVEAKVVNDVKADACVEGRLLDLFCKA